MNATSTAISFAAAGRAKPRFVATVGAKPPHLTKAPTQLGKPASLVGLYEADPCGYRLARKLLDQGYHCAVIAPAKFPASLETGSRLTAAMPCSWPVSPARDEAIRDLSRAREDAVRAHRLNL